ncbi:hypothetical protein FRC04_001867 [Tulasnella sp. 424]|nr:hypothetical protein FRC04_001867 [Tulasnella sp. 424]KAG8977648.1 hypothetical protein FRC05_000904 [Tulasnella sp. 425]
MGFWNNDSDQQQAADAYDQVTNAPHKAELSHELIAAAASYEASKAYEKHEAENGQPPSHAEAKELIAAVGGGFIDRLVETKGLDFVDRERAKRQAQQQAEDQISSNY